MEIRAEFFPVETTSARCKDCTVQTPKGEANVIYATLSMDGNVDGLRSAVNDLVHRAGGRATWRINATVERSYVLLELPDAAGAAAIAAQSGATVHEKPIIALALSPTVPEALPAVVEALEGTGRPAGVLCCIVRAGMAIVEWDPAITEPGVIFKVIDLELARFRSGRVAELLSPLPPSIVAGIAASGLRAPEIEPGRILELRIDE